MDRPSPHQHHSVVNRNKRSKLVRERDTLIGVPPLNTIVGSDVVAADLEGRLTVVATRNVELVIPHTFSDDSLSYDDEIHRNEINQLGPMHETCVPLAVSRDFESFMSALGKRSNFEQDGADDDITDAALEEALAIIGEIPDHFEPWDENELDRQRWLSKFDEGKIKRMEKAYEEIPYTSAKELGVKTVDVKPEILVKRNDEEWAPRVINAGTDCFNAVTGPASCVVMERLVHLTRVLKVQIGEAKVEFAYKTTDVKLCEFLFDDPQCDNTVEGDFSRNDREQRSRVALIYDAWLKKLNMPAWFRTLLLDLEFYTIQNFKYGFRGKVKYQLATGTTSTTPRNSTFNATMFAVALRRQGNSGRCVVLGDDILARLLRKLILEGWIQTVTDFKMVLKAKAPRINGEATLLSRRIFAEVQTPCMVPLLGKMLVRFNARASINSAVSDSQYMAGKALSYAYECRHVPFIREFYLRRYNMEDDKSTVRLQDLTWFTKTSNQSLGEIVKAISNERVVISDWEFGAWCCEQYDLDLEEIRELFEATICDASATLLDLPNIANLLCDV